MPTRNAVNAERRAETMRTRLLLTIRDKPTSPASVPAPYRRFFRVLELEGLIQYTNAGWVAKPTGTPDWKPTATLRVEGDTVHLDVTWSGPEVLDRPCTGGWQFNNDRRGVTFAGRLAQAINAGRAYREPKLVRDVNGHSYIEATTTQFFHKRHMDASLRAVGF